MAKDHFQASYATILKAHMTALKKRKDKKKVKWFYLGNVFLLSCFKARGNQRIFKMKKLLLI